MTTPLTVRAAVAALAGASLIALSACAATPVTGPGTGPGSAPTAADDAFPVDVVGEGWVLQAEGEPAEFCLGAIAESYPPQCSGIELVGWDWDAVDGEETASGVTFGSYAAWGSYDGTRLAVTDAVMLALYDPMVEVDPRTEDANAGTSTEAELAEVHELIHESAPFEVLDSYVDNGYVWARVVFDDGAIQEWADARFGKDVVVIRSALKTLPTP